MSWIDDYLTYTEKNEAPQAFHLWSGLSALAAVVRRNVWIDRGFYKIYPGQLMVILVAGSAKMRKSTAIKIALNIVKGVPDVVTLSGKSSPEAFIDSMNLGNQSGANGAVGPRDSCIFLAASELSSFLSKQAYTEALIPILTDLADAPDVWKFRTRGHGEVVLNNVCLTMLGASTPDWLAEAIPRNSFGGGFMSRILFVYEDKSDRVNAMPTREDINPKFELELMLRLQEISQQTGPIGFTPAGRLRFVEWYHEYMSKTESNQEGYWGRRPDHTLRLASLLTLANEGPLAIDEVLIDKADVLLSVMEEGLSKAFQFIGGSSITHEQELFLRILRKLGGAASFGEIMHDAWRKIDNTMARQVVDTLKAANIIEEATISGISYIKLLKQD